MRLASQMCIYLIILWTAIATGLEIYHPHDTPTVLILHYVWSLAVILMIIN